MSAADPFKLVTVWFHYGGSFEGDGQNLKYVHGIEFEQKFYLDMICYFDLLAVCKEAGFCNIAKILWLTPGRNLGNGLQLLWNDATIMEMSKYLSEFGIVDVYIEHGVDEAEVLSDGHLPDIEAEPPESERGMEEGFEDDNDTNNATDKEARLDDEVESEHSKETGSDYDGLDEDVEGDSIDGLGEDYDMESGGDGNKEHEVREGCQVDRGDDVQSSDSGAKSVSDMSNYMSERDEAMSGGEGRTKFPIYSKGTTSLELSMLFDNARQFKEAVTQESFRAHRPIKWVRNHYDRVKAICANSGCPFEVYASFNKSLNSFQIKTFHSEHKCNKSFKNPRMTAQVLADMYVEKIRMNPNISVKELKEIVKSDLELNVAISLLRRAKAKVVEKVVSNFKEEFGMLWDYAAAIRVTNPGSCVKMQVDRTLTSELPIFKRYFVLFDALRRGFEGGCRKFLGLDGCFLKSLTKGELLTAVGRDGNNNMYPLAWAVVEVECTDSWRWFIRLLQDELHMGDGGGWTLITDQQKGLLNAIDEFLPRAEHRNCARHLYVNWAKQNKGLELKRCFWKIVKSGTPREFEVSMSELRAKKKSAAEELLRHPPERWCRAFFNPDSNCDMVDNNLCEAFNSTLVEARSMPIITMLEEIRQSLMRRVVRKRKDSMQWIGGVGPNIRKQIEENASAASKLNVLWNGDQGHEVGRGDYRCVVNLESRKCSCGRFAFSGIPCSHAICAIYDCRKNPYDFVSNWYSQEMYDKAYGYSLQPMPGKSEWPKSQEAPVGPPPYRKMPGRHKKNRRKDVDEPKKGKGTSRQANEPNKGVGGKQKMSRKGVKMTCRLCRMDGHNIRGCPSRLSESSPSEAQPVSSTPVSTAPVSNAPISSTPAEARTMREASMPVSYNAKSYATTEIGAKASVSSSANLEGATAAVEVSGKGKATATASVKIGSMTQFEELDSSACHTASRSGNFQSASTNLNRSRQRGFGLYVEPATGRTVLNPGVSGEQLIAPANSSRTTKRKEPTIISTQGSQTGSSGRLKSKRQKET